MYSVNPRKTELGQTDEGRRVNGNAYLEVSAQMTLLHCSTTAGWCLQLATISLAVFQ